MTDKYKNSEVVTPEVWRQMGLRDDEYKLIVEKLGREPNYTELGLFSVLWSELLMATNIQKPIKNPADRGTFTYW